MRTELALAVCPLIAALTGCAGAMGSNCSLGGTVYKVAPATGMADHSMAAPANQQQFLITSSPTAPQGCPVPTLVTVVYGAWTSADPMNVSVSSAHDATNGLATCLGTTASPVNLTTVFASTETTTVTLTCK